MRILTRNLIGAALLCGAVFGIPASAAGADSAANALAGLEPIAPEALSDLNGRQGPDISIVTSILTGTQSFEIESTNNNVEAGTMNSGLIGLNNSFHNARGVNNIAANTGIGANVQNGLILLINMH